MAEFIRDLVGRFRRIPETRKPKVETKVRRDPKEIIQTEREYHASEFGLNSIFIPITQVWNRREALALPPKDILEAIRDDPDFPRLKIIFQDHQSGKFTGAETKQGYESNRKRFLEKLDWINKIENPTLAAKRYEGLCRNIALGDTSTDDLWGPSSMTFRV